MATNYGSSYGYSLFDEPGYSSGRTSFGLGWDDEEERERVMRRATLANAAGIADNGQQQPNRDNSKRAEVLSRLGAALAAYASAYNPAAGQAAMSMVQDVRDKRAQRARATQEQEERERDRQWQLSRDERGMEHDTFMQRERFGHQDRQQGNEFGFREAMQEDAQRQAEEELTRRFRHEEGLTQERWQQELAVLRERHNLSESSARVEAARRQVEATAEAYSRYVPDPALARRLAEAEVTDQWPDELRAVRMEVIGHAEAQRAAQREAEARMARLEELAKAQTALGDLPIYDPNTAGGLATDRLTGAVQTRDPTPDDVQALIDGRPVPRAVKDGRNVRVEGGGPPAGGADPLVQMVQEEGAENVVRMIRADPDIPDEEKRALIQRVQSLAPSRAHR